MVTRRRFLGGTATAALAAGALIAARGAAAATQWERSYSGAAYDGPAANPGRAGRDYRPVTTPNGATLPWKEVDGVKVYHLIAEPVEHEFASGLKARCWGYNGRVHGPTIEAVEGDRVRVYVTNRLEAPTTVHWHGVFLPNGMDGVGGLTQPAIQPGETFRYEWTWRQHGTFMYHSHHDEMTQMAMGMMGMIVVHPRNPAPEQIVDRDFALLLSEWRIEPGTYRPDPNEMTDFNLLTMNARCYPGTEPLLVQRGERVRIRFGNLSAMDHHPIHLHGHYLKVTATDGGDIPVTAQWPETTVLVPTGSTRTVEFIADALGDWAMHCHMTHHIMNQMGHDAPNLIGLRKAGLDKKLASLLPGYLIHGETGMGEHGVHVEEGHLAVPENSIPMVGARGPYDYITMGGMFTLLKVRERLDGESASWYRQPAGSRARLASAEELRRDGIDA